MKTLATCSFLLLACLDAQAEPALPDPTRPPPGLQASGAASAPVMPDALVLQSVLLGPGRTPAAVISGQLVPLGGQVGELRLSRITAAGVQLKGSQGTTSLTLVPEGQKTARNTRTELAK